MQKRSYTTLVMLLILTGQASVSWAGTATLSWNPNSESDLSGYKIYYGIASTVYTAVEDVALTATPNSPEFTIASLMDGNTYYFTVTAYDTSGNESNFSNEVRKDIF